MEINKSSKYIHAALNARALRQDLISSNIANADTPFYRSKDINFEQALAEAAHQEFNKRGSKRLEMAKSSSMHMDPKDMYDTDKPTMFYRDGHMARNDGNTVDIDVEMGELSKNGVMYTALIEAQKKNKSIFLSVIDAGKNL